MLTYLHVPLSWKELVKRTASEVLADDVLNLAAQQAYYFFFALFPAILTLISIASFFPVANVVDEVIRMLGRVAPPEVLKIITDQIKSISESKQGGVLTFAFLLTIWSSSGALVSIISTLNSAYDITESRPIWKVRLTALLLTLGISFFIIASIALIIAGPAFAQHLAAAMHLGTAFEWTWLVLQWPVVFAMVTTGIGLVYYFAPDAVQEWVWITPGSVLATALWVLVSLAFKVYVVSFGNFNATYGTLGAFIVLLTWFYLSALAILIGAEMNAEIEHASPYGKNPGEKVPGEKKLIGVAARRDFEERKAKGEVPIRPFPDGVNCDLDHPPTPARKERAPGAPARAHRKQGMRASDWLIGAAVMLPAALKVGKEIRSAVAPDDPNRGDR